MFSLFLARSVMHYSALRTSAGVLGGRHRLGSFVMWPTDGTSFGHEGFDGRYCSTIRAVTGWGRVQTHKSFFCIEQKRGGPALGKW